jgi:hypothetical protein
LFFRKFQGGFGDFFFRGKGRVVPGAAARGDHGRQGLTGAAEVVGGHPAGKGDVPVLKNSFLVHHPAYLFEGSRIKPRGGLFPAGDNITQNLPPSKGGHGPFSRSGLVFGVRQVAKGLV